MPLEIIFVDFLWPVLLPPKVGFNFRHTLLEFILHRFSMDFSFHPQSQAWILFLLHSDHNMLHGTHTAYAQLGAPHC